MVILTLLKSQGHTAIQQWNFPQQAIIRVGRAGDNHIILEDYPEVSRYHLELKKIDNSSWQLLSKGTNGTFLNGILTTQGLLTNGSIIQLAK
ncbi:MAG: FHA domain-containing protein [Spirulinaceae cyanobacterium]